MKTTSPVSNLKGTAVSPTEKVYYALRRAIGSSNGNVVVFSALWPFLRMIGEAPDVFSRNIIDTLISNSRTVFMPAFTDGFKNGACDLDRTPSTTGALTEIFRNTKGVRRTVCPFFSFGVYGESSNQAVELRPRHAWGEGSLYEWFENNDATIITLGTHPTHCSFTHRAEWHCRSIIKYRYDKLFSGEIRHEGNTFSFQEMLAVRMLKPLPQIDWTWALNDFMGNGMKIYDVEGVKISAMRASAKMKVLIPLIEKDPLCLIKNKLDFMEVSCEGKN